MAKLRYIETGEDWHPRQRINGTLHPSNIGDLWGTRELNEIGLARFVPDTAQPPANSRQVNESVELINGKFIEKREYVALPPETRNDRVADSVKKMDEMPKFLREMLLGMHNEIRALRGEEAETYAEFKAHVMKAVD